MVIDRYSIDGCWCLLMAIGGYWWLLIGIILVAIGGYFVIGYWWLLMVIILVTILLMAMKWNDGKTRS